MLIVCKITQKKGFLKLKLKLLVHLFDIKNTKFDYISFTLLSQARDVIMEIFTMIIDSVERLDHVTNNSGVISIIYQCGY